MATGTTKVIGFIMAAQRPIDEHFLNEGIAWATTAEALAGIPFGSRSPGKLINVAGILYWFKSNLTELEKVFSASAPIASDIAIADEGSLFTVDNVEDALAEVKTQANATDTVIANLTGVSQTEFTILLPASASVAGRLAGSVTKPDGWTLTASGAYDLLVTHGLTGRKVSSVDIFEIDGDDERLLPPFSSAYSGIVVNGLTAKIEGLAPTLLALRVEIFVNL